MGLGAAIAIARLFRALLYDVEPLEGLVDSPVDRIEAFGASLVGGFEDAVQARMLRRSVVRSFLLSRSARTTWSWPAPGLALAEGTSIASTT